MLVFRSAQLIFEEILDKISVRIVTVECTVGLLFQFYTDNLSLSLGIIDQVAYVEKQLWNSYEFNLTRKSFYLYYEQECTNIG
jgi:hypothetical protein